MIHIRSYSFSGSTGFTGPPKKLPMKLDLLTGVLCDNVGVDLGTVELVVLLEFSQPISTRRLEDLVGRGGAETSLVETLLSTWLANCLSETK
jgi:hypothetical protein